MTQLQNYVIQNVRDRWEIMHKVFKRKTKCQFRSSLLNLTSKEKIFICTPGFPNTMHLLGILRYPKPFVWCRKIYHTHLFFIGMKDIFIRFQAYQTLLYMKKILFLALKAMFSTELWLSINHEKGQIFESLLINTKCNNCKQKDIVLDTAE